MGGERLGGKLGEEWNWEQISLGDLDKFLKRRDLIFKKLIGHF